MTAEQRREPRTATGRALDDILRHIGEPDGRPDSIDARNAILAIEAEASREAEGLLRALTSAAGDFLSEYDPDGEAIGVYDIALTRAWDEAAAYLLAREKEERS